MYHEDYCNFSVMIDVLHAFLSELCYCIVCHYGEHSEVVVNPLTPRSDQYINSPYNFSTLSSRQVMRIEKIIN